jgi:outer membrane protein assembly factor BamB
MSVNIRDPAFPAASRIYCLDAETGRVIWKHRGGGLTRPAVAGGKVYFASTSDPFFYCVDEKGNKDETTTCLWKYKMGDRVYESAPAIYGGKAYILCRDGYLYAFK